MLLIRVHAAFVSDYGIFFEGHTCERDKSADSGGWEVEKGVWQWPLIDGTTVALNIKLLLNKNLFIVNPTNITHIHTSTHTHQFHIRVYVIHNMFKAKRWIKSASR